MATLFQTERCSSKNHLVNECEILEGKLTKGPHSDLKRIAISWFQGEHPDAGKLDQHCLPAQRTLYQLR